jgi:excinuclease ABC subunit A
MAKQISKKKEQEAVLAEEFIEVFGAREHNLKNIDITIPKNKLVVFTGCEWQRKIFAGI